MSQTSKDSLWTLILFLLIILCEMEKISAARTMRAKAMLQISSNATLLPSADRKRSSTSHSSYASDNFYANSNVVDVTSFGAKGDGVTDDTMAFEAAWQAACSTQSATLHVPPNHRFLLGPVTFTGPCQSNIVFQIDGSMIAQVNPRAWASKLLDWINFSKLNGITVTGSGFIDGHGAVWWMSSQYDDEKSSQGGSNLPSIRPTALRFYGSYDVRVQGITIQNSPQCHLKFDSCTSVKVVGVTISSPANSPNTDGIHLQNSRDVEIHHSSMACGDDCVSIQTGCTGISVHNINCGPGHVISIGGLGKGGTKARVSNVTVYDSNIQDALYGVRIKTWQGGVGSVRGVSFSSIQVSNVRVPVDIDQFFCDGKACTNRTSAVYISDVTYQTITGTYMDTPVYLACSDDVPCTDLKLINIQLKPAAPYHKPAFCWNSYGYGDSTNNNNAVECVRSGKPLRDPARSRSSRDGC